MKKFLRFVWKFSPRMWRCFLITNRRNTLDEIFSTYVEVFPIHCKSDCKHGNFLHVCGGVSMMGERKNPEDTIFSTYVEVFL